MKNSKNPLFFLFAGMWKYSQGNRKTVVAFSAMFVIVRVLELIAPPLIWARIIKIVTDEGVNVGNIKMLTYLLLTTVVIDAFFWCLHGPARVLERLNAFKVRSSYKQKLLCGVVHMPMEWHVENHSGDTIDKVKRGTDAMYDFSEATFVIIYTTSKLIISFAVLIYFSPESTPIVVATILLAVWITLRIDKSLISQYKEINSRENAVSESIFDTISNITTVVILRVERLLLKMIADKIEKPYKLFKRNSIINEFKWFLTNMCCNIMIALVVFQYIYNNIGAAAGAIVSSLYLLITYLNKVGEVFYEFTTLYGKIVKQRADIMNSEALSDKFVQYDDKEHELPSSWQEIAISDLKFSYEKGGKIDLDAKWLHFRRGEKIAFIGESGGGKTTCLKLLAGLHPPDAINLAVDGLIMPSGLDSISQGISLIPQSPEIFATTIEDNITFGADHDSESVERCIELACFGDVISKLPNGINTSMKEKGVSLSGGQQQRLALARGLLAAQDKNIVLLDEPTSSLDPVTEMSVYRNIFNWCNGKTIISTVHRPHLLPLFDRIVMFEGGRIVEDGTLTQLLTCSRRFQKMWNESTTKA